MQPFIVPLSGLAPGKTHFRWHAEGQFFSAFENSEILDADLVVDVWAEKSGRYAAVDLGIEGTVVVECDRCLEDLTLKVDIEPHLTVGFGAVDVDDDGGDDDVLVIDRSESELNLNQFVYDYICLGLPLVKVHPEGKCNPEMLRYITESEGTDTGLEGETSRPFEGLKDLLENKDN